MDSRYFATTTIDPWAKIGEKPKHEECKARHVEKFRSRARQSVFDRRIIKLKTAFWHDVIRKRFARNTPGGILLSTLYLALSLSSSLAFRVCNLRNSLSLRLAYKGQHRPKTCILVGGGWLASTDLRLFFVIVWAFWIWLVVRYHSYMLTLLDLFFPYLSFQCLVFSFSPSLSWEGIIRPHFLIVCPWFCPGKTTEYQFTSLEQ